MKRYRVISKVLPASRIDGGIKLDFKENDGSTTIVRITPIKEKTNDGNELQVGWKLWSDTSAENKDAAIYRTGTLIDGILSHACLITGTSFDVIKPEIVYNIDNNTRNEFMQLFNSGPIPSRRKLDGNLLVELIEKTGSPPTKQYFDRITRAIRWYRMGVLITDDVLSSYDCFWKGLESLNRILAELLKAPEIYDICSKCGNKTKQTTTSGIKKFIVDNYQNGEEQYKKYRNIRVSIVHSTKNINELLPEVRSLYQNLAGVLYDAIMFILEIKHKKSYELILNQKMGIAIEGFLLNDNGQKLSVIEKHPQLIPKNIQVLSVKEIDDDISMSLSAELNVNLPNGYTLNVDTMRLYGQDVSSFKVIDVGKKQKKHMK